MAQSSRRSRRLKAEASQQLISFSIRGEAFAVPINLVNKVVTVDRVHYGLQSDGPGLVTYLDRQISVLQLGHQLFSSDVACLPGESTTSVQAQPPSHMLVIQSPTYELVGLLIETQPALIRVPTSAFLPVPTTYLQSGQLRCIGALINRQELPPMFLVNIGELLGQVHPRSRPPVLKAEQVAPYSLNSS
ncbi:MAG: chemotaxis protein CheW, partial [Elainellaceae cyanobacterium]